MAVREYLILLLFPLSACVLLYGARKEKFRFVRGPKRPSWLKGHMIHLFHPRLGPRFHDSLIEDYDRVAKVFGFFGDEQLYLSDPEAIRYILSKDGEIFEETKVFTENNKIIFGEGLVATTGDHHRRQRKLVAPAFSVHRVRGLVPLFYDVAFRLRDALLQTVADNHSTSSREGGVVDISQWMSRAALESVGLAGIGLSLDPLNSSSINPYSAAVRNLIPTLFAIAPLRLLTPFLTQLGPPWFRRALLDLVPIKAVQDVKRMSDVMDLTCREILSVKREDSQNLEGSSRDAKDVMSILLRANEEVDEKDRLSDAELVGQMNVLIFGAQDTTASALSRVIYLLSRPENKHWQEELRDEIMKARETCDVKDLGYDEISSLPLLDSVIKETLRLYPPVPFVRRVAKKPTSLQLCRPINLSDNSEKSSLSVPENTVLWLSISGMNRSEEIWGSDAAIWDPRRWFKEDDRISTGLKVPGSYSGMLTFLGGARSCIGYRFALLEMKIILTTLLSTFTFSATDDDIVWNLSQIVSPSVRQRDSISHGYDDRQGMPISLTVVSDKS